jgi:hypothetical protein
LEVVVLFELFKKDFKDHKILNFERPYKNFYFKNGYNQNLVNTEYWWAEDFVHDFLITKKVFNNSPIFYTRECEMNPKSGFCNLVKGPFSPVDLWVPGEAFIEIKYTSYQCRDYWGYDFYPKKLSNIWHYIKDTKHKIYLILIHGIDSVSMIDLSDMEKITRVRNFIKLDVTKNNCFKRWDNLRKEIRSYMNQDYIFRDKIKESIKNEME